MMRSKAATTTRTQPPRHSQPASLAARPGSAQYLVRPALEKRQIELQQHSYTLLVAPQGYGKSHIMGVWYTALIESGIKPVWITLDSTHNDTTKLACAIRDACCTVLPRDDVESLPTPEHFDVNGLHQLGNILGEFGENLILFIDQYETLNESAALEGISEFLLRLPPTVHRVVASNVPPHWFTPKLQLSETLQLLDREALMFSTPELEQFMRLEGHQSLTEEDILKLSDVTRGWPAALKLLSMTLKSAVTPGDKSRVLQGKSPLLLEYLDRNVIADLPEALKDFVFTTAHLQRLRADLCNHIVGMDSADQQLEALLEQGILEGNSYAGNWYAYPPLLRNFLRWQLEKEDANTLADRHCKASDWYLEFGLPDASLYHALQARDYERAVVVYANHARDLVVAGDAALIEEFVNETPQHILQQHPYFLWPYLWMLVISQRFQEAGPHLAELQQRLESGVVDRSNVPLMPSEEDLKVIEYRIKQALDSDWADPAVWLKLKKLKKKRGSAEDFLQEQIELSLGSAYFRCKKFSEAYTSFYESKRLAVLNHTPITMVSTTVRMAEIRYIQGQLQDAMHQCTEAIDLARLVPGQFSLLSGIPLLLMSRIFYDQNLIPEAEQRFYEAQEMFRIYRATHYLKDSTLQRARLANASSGANSALHILEEAIGNLAEHGFEANCNQLRAEQVKYEVLAGRFDQAEALLQRLGTPLGSRGPSPTFYCKRSEENLYLNYCLYLIKTGSHSTASAWLTKLFNQAKSADELVWSVEIAVLLVLAHDGCNDDSRTLRSVREMLLLAERTGVVRPLLEGGNRIQQLVKKLCATQAPGDPAGEHRPGGKLLTLLLEPGKESGDPGSAEDRTLPALSTQADTVHNDAGLTPRELELLVLVSEGHSNKMIAGQLIISVGTVKWHLKNIFLKLGVSSRTQAISKARAIGLTI
jgi:LuxR family transcriptional regulator, maltose regulon positive regulatory protein